MRARPRRGERRAAGVRAREAGRARAPAAVHRTLRLPLLLLRRGEEAPVEAGAGASGSAGGARGGEQHAAPRTALGGGGWWAAARLFGWWVWARRAARRRWALADECVSARARVCVCWKRARARSDGREIRGRGKREGTSTGKMPPFPRSTRGVRQQHEPREALTRTREHGQPAFAAALHRRFSAAAARPPGRPRPPRAAAGWPRRGPACAATRAGARRGRRRRRRRRIPRAGGR